MSAPNTPARIEVRLRELSQLFNSMDPSPFFDKDLDADAEDFIVGWARELPHDRPLQMVIYLGKRPVDDEEAQGVEEAVQHYFAHKSEHARREFSELMRRGRMSLLIGLLFLAACLLLSNFIRGVGAMWDILRESLIIAGWVAMWRPLEIFLYEWWPIRRQVRLYRRLSRADVQLHVAD